MATAKPLSARKLGRPPRGKWLAWIGFILLAVLLAACWPTIRAYAVAGASVGARVACSCRYVGGRDLSDCRKDFEPGMSMIVLTEDDTAKSVTARLPLLSRETATFRAGEGCTLDRWD
ncbi:MAG: hypothetical protein ACTHLU_08845 [Novosphingobium sp.]